MKKIIFLFAFILILSFFLLPTLRVVTNCVMTKGDPMEIKILTPFQAFKDGYLQIPTPNNNWTFKTEPPNSCV